MKTVELKVLSYNCNLEFVVSGKSEHKICAQIGLGLPKVLCVDGQQQILQFRCQKCQVVVGDL